VRAGKKPHPSLPMAHWEIIEQHIQNMEEALAELRKYGNIGAPACGQGASIEKVVESKEEHE